MDSQELEQVTEEKDPGVLVDDELKFHRQTAAAVKKVNTVLGMVKKSFVLFDEVTYHFSTNHWCVHTEHGKVIWGPFSKGDIKSVEKILKKSNEAGTTNQEFAI